MLEDGSVFLCGGGVGEGQEDSKVAYLLWRNGDVDEYFNMLSVRRDHGSIEIRDFVYVFGGGNS